MNVENILRLAKFIREDVPKSMWCNSDSFLSRWADITGWACILRYDLPWEDKDINLFDSYDQWYDAENELVDWLELSDEQIDMRWPVLAASKEQVAKVLEHLAATGIVDYGVAKPYEKK